MSAQPAVLQVVILRDGLLVGTEVFVPGQYVLGSSENAELKLDDPNVEGTHAKLFFQNNRVAIQDAGSQWGVYVNGHRIKACEIRPVDEVTIGPFSLKVRVISQKGQTQEAAPPDVAKLLGAPKAAGKSASANSSTVVSPRRVSAAPQAEPSAPPPVPRVSHLRAVPTEPPPPPPPVAEFHDDEPTRVMPPEPEMLEKVRRAPPAKVIPHPNVAMVEEATKSVVTTIDRPSKRTKLSVPKLGDGKGAPHLFLELYWGADRQAARCFKDIPSKKPLIGRADDNADVPLYGFDIPDEGFVVAEKKKKTYLVYIPHGATVEKWDDKDSFRGIDPKEIHGSGDRKYVGLTLGNAIRLKGDKDVSLVAYVQPKIPKPFSNPLRGIPWLTLFFLMVFGGGFGYFVVTHPPDSGPDFQGHTVSPVAVRLIAPKPAEKKKIEKKIEKMKEEKKVEKKPEKAPKKEPEKVVAKAEVKKTMKAIEKIAAAGPAVKDILAAVDKLGSGPGKKDAKDYKLSGLIGKAPIANAGLGTFGLGGGGSGGMGTKGLEVLRGKGGGGIGLLGAGNIGKGAVGGTVSHATARSIAAHGSIDKEAVAKVVNSHLQEVRACYERELLRDPGLAGKIVLEWGISTSGTVSSAKTKSSTMKNASVEGCIMNSLKTWKFPPAKGGNVIISYPFMFNSVGY